MENPFPGPQPYRASDQARFFGREDLGDLFGNLFGARRGKAIIVLNPAEPPVIMRNTVFCLSEEADTAAIASSIERMVEEVRAYVRGYRLKQDVQFDRIGSDNAMIIPGVGAFTGVKTAVFLEIEGSAHYLPAYAGNLDIMTSAALRTGERLAEQKWS